MSAGHPQVSDPLACQYCFHIYSRSDNLRRHKKVCLKRPKPPKIMIRPRSVPITNNPDEVHVGTNLIAPSGDDTSIAIDEGNSPVATIHEIVNAFNQGSIQILSDDEGSSDVSDQEEPQTPVLSDDEGSSDVSDQEEPQTPALLRPRLQYVYLGHELEYIQTDPNVYKIGNTRQNPPWKRFRGYKPGIEILLLEEVWDSMTAEQLIKKALNDTPGIIHRTDLGHERYEGSPDLMRQVIRKVVRTYNSTRP